MIPDIENKRNLLSMTRVRFAPSVQKLKEATIDHIVEQALRAFEPNVRPTPEQIQRSIQTWGHIHLIMPDISNALKRLIENGRISELEETKEEVKGKRKKHYALLENAKQELEELEREAARRLDAVIKKLFGYAKEGPKAYYSIFLKFLSVIFSKLAEESVRVIHGEVAIGDEPTSQLLPDALNAVGSDLRPLDRSLFKDAVVSFFGDKEPAFDALKWNMAQNYYLMKVLGLDPQGSLLSKEILSNAILYLDTNMVIPALEPTHDLHSVFIWLHESCRKLGIQFKVCRVTLDELQRLVQSQRETLTKVIDQIPARTAQKIRSDFYEIYLEKGGDRQQTNLDKVFENFASPSLKLKDDYGVELEEDSWLDENYDSPETINFAGLVQSRWSSMRLGEKREAASLHDSLCLRFMEILREQGMDNVWFLTKDGTLPGCVPLKCRFPSLAVTANALLQWISPIGVCDVEETKMASVFSDLIESRVLPQENILHPEDFLIFHELHMECRSLPAEDVENCIRCIKSKAPALDLSNPIDREKLAYEVAVFFTDPSRKYKTELDKLEKERVEEDRKHKDELRKLSEQMEGLRRRYETDEEQREQKSLLESAKLRLGITAIFFFVLEGLSIGLSSIYGVGENAFQKVLSAWVVWGIAVPASSVLFGRLFIGKERIRKLGWPIRKLFMPKN